VYTVTLIPGDGIGEEITDSVKEIFEHINAPIEWEQYNVSGVSSTGESLFKEAVDSLKRNRVGLKGILFTPISQGGHVSWNVAMRQQLDIYASVVLCKSLPGVPTRHKNVDFAIIRENTEGEYSGLEHQSYPGVVESLKISSRDKAERIVRFAFDFALKNGRKRVTCVHKANIMKLGDGLFLRTFRAVAEEYKSSGIEVNDMIVDNTSDKPSFFVVHSLTIIQLYATRCEASAIRCHGNAKLVRRNCFEHRCCFGWRPWCRSWLQCWHGNVLSLLDAGCYPYFTRRNTPCSSLDADM